MTMPTLQELLASGDLTSSQGTINVAVGGGIADALNQGAGFYGAPGLDIPGFGYHQIGPSGLPQPVINQGPDSGTGVSLQDALARNFTNLAVLNGVGQMQPIDSIGDYFVAIGVTDQAARDSLTKQIQAGDTNPSLGFYTPPETWGSILNVMSGHNAALSREEKQSAIAGFGTVLGAGFLNNAYGAGGTAGGTSGATTTGIGEAAAPAIGTELPAGTAASSGGTAAQAGGVAQGSSVAGMTAAEELAAAGFTSEQIAAFQESGFLPTAAGVGGAVNTASNAVNAGTALSRILDGTASKSDWLSVLGTAGATGLGVYSANRQTDSLNALANQYAGYGAPYRQRLSDLYANPSGFLSSPEVQVPVQQGTDAAARALSAKVGNPVFSGTALSELQNYASNQLFGKLGQEKDRLAGFGGLTGYNAAAPGAATAAIAAQPGALTTLAGGISDILNPKQSLTDLMKIYRGNDLFGTA